MLRRLLVVSAALVLFTGFAATAHADRFTVTNETGMPLAVHSMALKAWGLGDDDKLISINLRNGQTSDFIFGEQYRLWRTDFFAYGRPHNLHERWEREGQYTDPEKTWKLKVSIAPGGGELRVEISPEPGNGLHLRHVPQSRM